LVVVVVLVVLGVLVAEHTAALKDAKRIPITIWESKGNPRIDFLVVIMASCIAREHRER